MLANTLEHFPLPWQNKTKIRKLRHSSVHSSKFCCVIVVYATNNSNSEKTLTKTGKVRENNGQRHKDGIGYISASLKELARELNPVDDALYDFVSAKFCGSLQASSLVGHVLVNNELALSERLSARWVPDIWVTNPFTVPNQVGSPCFHTIRLKPSAARFENK